ncbi:Adenylyltransferase and sulfurtransferase MOCS3 [Termitomyces sp. J132]|nr:Adenylyltransferase and sulfurtransferase MOCS3 [Termitomyces sp. J132]
MSQSPRLSSSTSSVDHDVVRADNAPLVLSLPPPLRTLNDVRLQVAYEVAVRAITQAKSSDGVRIGVSLTLSKDEDELFLYKVADVIAHQLHFASFLFAIATTGSSLTNRPNPVVFVASSHEYVQRAILLTSAKFIGRIALWDIVRKCARAPMDPTLPPPGSRSIDQILSEARAQLQRITPHQAWNELREPEVGAPTFLVDIRPAAQRELGGIQGSLVIERNVLEWRFDPRSSSKLAIADRYDLRIIVFCQEGYTSSLAAYSLQQLGLLNATDIIGGYQAWKDAGLPVDDKARARALIE